MRDRLIIILFALLGLWVLQYYCLSDFILTKEVVGDLLTVFSIIFGFYIASLTIFSASKFVPTLYNNEIKTRNGVVTHLDILIKNYHLGLAIIFTSILYFVFLQIIITQTESGALRLSSDWQIAFFPILVINLGYTYLMLNDLISVIYQEARMNSLK